MMMVDIPTAVSGTEPIIKYDMGANMAPATQNARPNIRYGLFVISPSQVIMKDTLSGMSKLGAKPGN